MWPRLKEKHHCNFGAGYSRKQDQAGRESAFVVGVHTLSHLQQDWHFPQLPRAGCMVSSLGSPQAHSCHPPTCFVLLPSHTKEKIHSACDRETRELLDRASRLSDCGSCVSEHTSRLSRKGYHLCLSEQGSSLSRTFRVQVDPSS